jgi:hypothetical protein
VPDVIINQYCAIDIGVLAYLNIMRDERSNAVGFAKPLPGRNDVKTLN